MARFSIAVVALLAMAAGAAAQRVPPFPATGPPLILKLEGVIQPTKAAAERTGFTVTSLAFAGAPTGDQRWLGVTKARTVGGDQPLDGKDVLAVVAPFTPNSSSWDRRSWSRSCATPLPGPPSGSRVSSTEARAPTSSAASSATSPESARTVTRDVRARERGHRLRFHSAPLATGPGATAPCGAP